MSSGISGSGTFQSQKMSLLELFVSLLHFTTFVDAAFDRNGAFVAWEIDHNSFEEIPSSLGPVKSKVECSQICLATENCAGFEWKRDTFGCSVFNFTEGFSLQFNHSEYLSRVNMVNAAYFEQILLIGFKLRGGFSLICSGLRSNWVELVTGRQAATSHKAFASQSSFCCIWSPWGLSGDLWRPSN